jgi:hypothetical protein
VYYAVDTGSPFGAYYITVNPEITIFASANPKRPNRIPVDVSDSAVIAYVPEPTSPAVLGAAALLGLLRRRRSPGRAGVGPSTI